jgi:hypothetical protein
MANGHGGSRENAGRKKGGAARRSEESMRLAREKGVDPVAMLLDLTQWAYGQFQENKTKDTADMVKDYAKECAPYVSPKLAAIESSGPDGGPMQITWLTDSSGL